MSNPWGLDDRCAMAAVTSPLESPLSVLDPDSWTPKGGDLGLAGGVGMGAQNQWMYTLKWASR